jgi:Txe/YoeB family toxin of Txe-Axe toxin-antitoxin module
MALPAAPQNDSVSSNDDNQLLADDVDVLEKEWVEKAKKIVHETKEDPYLQEKEVSKLQSDYLQKRYGKQIKVTE